MSGKSYNMSISFDLMLATVIYMRPQNGEHDMIKNVPENKVFRKIDVLVQRKSERTARHSSVLISLLTLFITSGIINETAHDLCADVIRGATMVRLDTKA